MSTINKVLDWTISALLRVIHNCVHVNMATVMLRLLIYL